MEDSNDKEEMERQMISGDKGLKEKNNILSLNLGHKWGFSVWVSITGARLWKASLLCMLFTTFWEPRTTLL